MRPHQRRIVGGERARRLAGRAGNQRLDEQQIRPPGVHPGAIGQRLGERGARVGVIEAEDERDARHARRPAAPPVVGPQDERGVVVARFEVLRHEPEIDIGAQRMRLRPARDAGEGVRLDLDTLRPVEGDRAGGGIDVERHVQIGQRRAQPGERRGEQEHIAEMIGPDEHDAADRFERRGLPESHEEPARPHHPLAGAVLQVQSGAPMICSAAARTAATVTLSIQRIVPQVQASLPRRKQGDHGTCPTAIMPRPP